MRTLKDPVKLDHTFSITIVEDCFTGEWDAQIIGRGLDNIVSGGTPIKALEAACDLIRLLAGRCYSDTEHDWSVDTKMEDRPAWQCSKCFELAVKEEFDEY